MEKDELHPGILKASEYLDQFNDECYSFLVLWYGLLIMVEMCLADKEDWLISAHAPVPHENVPNSEKLDSQMRAKAESIARGMDIDIMWFRRGTRSQWEWELATHLGVAELLELEEPKDNGAQDNECPLCKKIR